MGVYHALRRGDPITWEAQMYLLAERTGWTLDYIRNMDIQDFLNMLEVLRALDAAQAHEMERAREKLR